jgi:hypothetical protein
MSTTPKPSRRLADRAGALDAVAVPGDEADVRAGRRLAHLVARRLAARRVAAVDGDARSAGASEGGRRGEADAGRSAGDQHGRLFQSHRFASWSLAHAAHPVSRVWPR